MKKIFAAVSICVILFLSFVLRYWNYGLFPGSGETKDEYAWSWLGQSLLAGNPPTSWSWFDHYKNKYVLVLDQNTYPIASPVFDNPPLFSLIPGIMLTLRGINEIQIPSITLIRWPMLFLGVLNVILVFLTGLLWRNRYQALIASLLMATIPTIVFASRMVLAENLLVTWMLTVLVGLKLFENTRKPLWLYIIGFASGLCILTKVLGIFVPAAIFTYMLLTQPKRHAVTYALITAATACLWLVYALYYGFDVFIATQLAQSSLSIGWGSIVNLFLRLFIVDQYFLDGWVILGLIMLFAQFFHQESSKQTRTDPFFLLFIFWLIFLVAAVGEQTWHGWYKYPLHPLMVIHIAGLIESASSKLVHLIPVYLFGVLNTLRLTVVMLDVKINSFFVRVGILLILGLLIADWLKVSPKYRKVIIWALFIIAVTVNSIVVLKFNPGLLHRDNINFFPPGAGV